jgi:hypothetical protein
MPTVVRGNNTKYAVHQYWSCAVSVSEQWRETKYADTFDEELRGLERRRAAQPGCTVEDIEGILKHLYIMDGADWGGRGDVQDTVMAATIAAYEHFIAQWKAEMDAPSPAAVPGCGMTADPVL